MCEAKHTTESYEHLARHMDEAPIGAPYTVELVEILQSLFSSAEAELASRLPFKPTRLEKLAQRMGMDEGELGQTLEEMADRGLVFQSGDRFSLLPLVPGMAETQFMGGRTGEAKRDLAQLFENYYPSGIGQAMVSLPLPYSRVIPVGKTVENHQEILPYEQAAEVVKEASFTALTSCYCRNQAELLGKGCKHPKDVCLLFGPFARYAAQKGWAREIDREEALKTLDKAAEAGLIHVTDNVAQNVNFMCNCCGCCCMFLKTLTQLKHPGAVAPAGFTAEVDRAECTACGACVEACQVEAIRQEDDEPAIVDPDYCLGCGQCKAACFFDAINLERRGMITPPPDNWLELAAQLKAGRLGS
jgi:electron transport complex protein RnfB